MMWMNARAAPMAACVWPTSAARRHPQRSHVRCSSAPETPEACPPRRSANYQPNSWDYDALLSLKRSDHALVSSSRYDKLRGSIKDLLLDNEASSSSSKLRLIDAMQRLGISYRFEEEISGILSCFSMEADEVQNMDDVASTALKFRLLRQNGFLVTPEPLSGFNRKSYTTMLKKDASGLLSLHEASYLSFENEEILDTARTFSTNALKDLMPSMHPNIRNKLAHALDLPLHWRTPRLEARWSIDHYCKDISFDRLLLQFAVLDFNTVQCLNQEELANVTRWWKDVGLGEKLTFARDRLMECFHYANGIVWEPDHGACREMLAKICALIVHLDDVYDVYGSLDELELLTEVIERWDPSPSELLPEYMQALYSVIYNVSNEVADQALKEHGCSIHAFLGKAWYDLCTSFLMEAKWHHGNYRPYLEEYLSNGWMSSSAPLLLLHAFPMLSSEISAKTLDQIQSYPKLIQSASMIFRLCNDFVTHSEEMKRGDAPSFIAVHMYEKGANEQDSREALHNHLLDAWKKINEEAFKDCHFSRTFAKACVNLARISHTVYQGGDGIGAPNMLQNKQIKDLFLAPILEEKDILDFDSI
ncbi:hypothetical protein ACP70R_011981 [Stipagrostis hirtigluma subsp. patula]